jgi:hypothetical protein
LKTKEEKTIKDNMKRRRKKKRKRITKRQMGKINKRKRKPRLAYLSLPCFF